MELTDALIVLLAGMGAGAMNAVVGAGTLITFPTLLALGIPPVVANVSNTVGLVPGSVAGAYGYRATLVGRGRLLIRLVLAAALGGISGGALLLALPPEVFAFAVPPLLVLSAVLAALQPRVAAAVLRRRAGSVPRDVPAGPPAPVRMDPWLVGLVFVTGIYGGYFGAAQGVILLAVLGIFVEGGLQQVNGIKNVLVGIANLVSALLFIVLADVDWRLAGLIAAGAAIGGAIGSRYGRRLPSRVLRALIVTIALAAAARQVWG